MLGGCQIRRGKLWRIAVVFAASGALALSGCASDTDTGEPTTDTTAATAEKVDEIANTVPEDIKSTGQAGRRRQHSVHAQRVQGSERQDRRLRRRPDERHRLHPRPDGGVSGGGLRQDHPVDSGRHLQRRHVVVHRHQGTRADRRFRHVLLGGLAVGAASGRGDRSRERVRQEGRRAGHHHPGDGGAAGEKQEVHRRRPAGDRDRAVRRAGRGHERRGARSGRRDVGGLTGDVVRDQADQRQAASRPARSSTPRRTAGR